MVNTRRGFVTALIAALYVAHHLLAGSRWGVTFRIDDQFGLLRDVGFAHHLLAGSRWGFAFLVDNQFGLFRDIGFAHHFLTGSRWGFAFPAVDRGIWSSASEMLITFRLVGGGSCTMLGLLITF